MLGLFYLEKGNAKQLPEIIATSKQGSINSTDVLILGAEEGGERKSFIQLDKYKNSKT